MKKYVVDNIIAERNWCVPATLEMILKHYGIDNVVQEDIAEQLTICDDDNANHREWGTHINKDTFNNFFSNNHIPLKERYISIDQFLDDYYMIEEIEQLLIKKPQF